MPTSVALSTHFKDFVRQQVDSGRYNNVSEVVRAGLRLLEAQEAEQEAKLQRLREALAKGCPCNGPWSSSVPAPRHSRYDSSQHLASKAQSSELELTN